MVKANPKRDANGKKLKVKVKRDVAKVLNKNDLVRRKLLAMNPYLQTLMDPFHGDGARIPDDQAYPSATFKIVQRVSATVNAQGVAAISLGQYRNHSTQVIYGGLVPTTTQVSPTGDYVFGQLHNTASTATDLFNTQAALADAVYLDRWTTGNNAIPSLFQYVRPVAIGCSVDYLGATLNAKGRITAGFAPKAQFRGTGFIGVDDIFRFPGSTQVPVNKLTGGTVLYKPLDYTSFNYTNESQVYDYSTLATTEPVYGGMFIAVDGATANDTVVFTIVAHYEGVPKTNQVDLVGVSPSRSDPLALAHAMNEVQQMPSAIPMSVFTAPPVGVSAQGPLSTGSYTAPVVTGFQGTSHTASEPAMLDSILGGVTKTVNTAADVIPKALPLIEMMMAML